MSPRKKANESEQATELEGSTTTTNAATAASSRAGSFDTTWNAALRRKTVKTSNGITFLAHSIHARSLPA